MSLQSSLQGSLQVSDNGLTAHHHLPKTLQQRRQQLADLVNVPVVLWSGKSRPRNYLANSYPFRASSHFLYFAGLPLENAVIRLEGGRLELFLDDPTTADLLWHGDTARRSQIAEQIGADAHYPLSALKPCADGAATVWVQDDITRLEQSQVLGRAIAPACEAQGIDLELVKAIVAVRLTHDAAAIAELRKAAAVSIQAHKTGMAITPTATQESDVRAAMEGVILAHNMTCAYSSIVTVQGEVLHNNHYHHPLQPGDLVLADVGAETESGWASDITRTWTVSGQFSATQRDIYDLVLAAHDRCIEQMQPGVEYRELHLSAATVIAAGLIDVGILKGRAEDLVEMDAHTLFFPHGIGHLIGLDVHDMEDFWDLAGYEPGRTRSDRFGLGYLRLDRPLRPGMVVSIEPGFYQVPALLSDPDRRATYSEVVDWDRLAQFADVRGIRIEDDVLVTETGADVLTAELPTQAEAIEALVQG